VNEFNDKSNSSIRDAVEKFKRGENLSDENQGLMNNLNSFMFNVKLVNDEIVEKYSLKGAEAESMTGFVEFVAENSGFEINIVERELNRLFRLGCLRNSDHHGAVHIAWS
jgi:hypothetical protein